MPLTDRAAINKANAQYSTGPNTPATEDPEAYLLQTLAETHLAHQPGRFSSLDITEMYEEKGETYQPSEDGFVFSKSEIDSAILRRNRERLSDEAGIWPYE